MTAGMLHTFSLGTLLAPAVSGVHNGSAIDDLPIQCNVSLALLFENCFL